MLLRTLAVLPFVGTEGFRTVADHLFREPAIRLGLGWTPVQIRNGDNQRHRHVEGRQAESLPCHPTSPRDALARVAERAWLKAQKGAVGSLFRRRLIRGAVCAIDGTGANFTLCPSSLRQNCCDHLEEQVAAQRLLTSTWALN
ncbi:MAG: hypothetical protein HYY04_15105 [Chloroflexi bacterium]|nr:hypothetical protein [Chloroflexota bacterium]